MVFFDGHTDIMDQVTDRIMAGEKNILRNYHLEKFRTGGCEGGMRELQGCPRKAPDTQATGVDVQPAETENVHTRKDLPDMAELEKWKVVKLRSFVRKLDGFPMTANEIRYANKSQLLSALEAYRNS